MVFKKHRIKNNLINMFGEVFKLDFRMIKISMLSYTLSI